MLQTAQQGTAEERARRGRGARAVYAWFSDRRLMVIKDGRQIALDAQDLAELRRFLAQFERAPGG